MQKRALRVGIVLLTLCCLVGGTTSCGSADKPSSQTSGPSSGSQTTAPVPTGGQGGAEGSLSKDELARAKVEQQLDVRRQQTIAQYSKPGEVWTEMSRDPDGFSHWTSNLGRKLTINFAGEIESN